MKSLKDIFEQAHRLNKLAGPGWRAYKISNIMHHYRDNIVAHICPGQNPLHRFSTTAEECRDTYATIIDELNARYYELQPDTNK